MMALEKGVTTKEILGTDSFQGSRVLAGEGSLEAPISNVMVMEVPDVDNWVYPGDFILTTGYSLSHDLPALIALVTKLKRLGVVGMAIKPKRFINEIPPDMITEAHKNDFPLIELPITASFSKITHEVFSLILEKNALPPQGVAPCAQKGFLTGLLLDEKTPRADLESLAHSSGIDLSSPLAVAVIKVPRQGSGTRRPGRAPAPAASLVERIASIFGLKSKHHCEAIGNDIALLADPSDFLGLIYRKKPLVDEAVCDPACSIGIGTAGTGIDAVRKSYHEAQFALTVGKELVGEKGIYPFDGLGFYRLLFEVRNHQNLKDFLHESLGKLEEYDLKHNGDFIETLEAFFLFDGNLMRMSKELMMHYNSVSYRLQRIQQILEADLKDQTTRINLELALKIRKILT
ncbi:MAG: PucR family transcriptional regulator ligand-binding domain-containing protein [Coriobacteriaceae bacterium]|jgi:purine catabolism regulator|nr:PucR family transcriptional regulator ligand-binding domain-containing protein [Coriobacteriaceae bacterium]